MLNYYHVKELQEQIEQMLVDDADPEHTAKVKSKGIRVFGREFHFAITRCESNEL